MATYWEKFVVPADSRVRLREIDPSYHGHYENSEAAADEYQKNLKKLEDLQYLLYSQRKHSLLIVLQGPDAGGKDGVVRHVITGMNPAGVRVVSFKQPTATELAHDFLWRIHSQVPGKGEVAVFNRSHYEDVLIVRVHDLVPKSMWSTRYDRINDFEKLLVEQNNTTILKFYLYISKEEQLDRFRDRLEDPARNWKISESDYTEREHWDDYLSAYEDIFKKTSKNHAPWFVIPSNKKWFRNLAISQIIAETLEKLKMESPKPTVDLPMIRQQYHAAKKKMRSNSKKK